MRANVEDQRKLLDIDALDQHIATLIFQKKSNPDIATITEMTARSPAIETSIVETDSQILEVKKLVSKAEVDVENITKRLEKDRARLNSDQTSAKELTQLQHEISTLENKEKELEEVELEHMEKLDDLEHKKSGLTDMLNQVKSEISQLNDKIKANFATLDNEIINLTSERNVIAELLPQDLLNLYEKIRTDHGKGAGLLSNGSCGACQIQIAAAEISALKSADVQEVLRCENCRCILVRN